MLELFQYDFIGRAFLAGIIIGAITPLIGLFLVVKRYSLMADTLAHVSLLGVAVGALLRINPVAGALITSVLTAWGMEELRRRQKLFGESVLALFLSGSLALALVLISVARGGMVNFWGYLFGNITTVSAFELLLIALFGSFVLITTIIFYKRFFLTAYDEELAQASGLNVRRINNLLIVLAAMTVSLSMRIVGVLLVGALMVIPVITALQYKRSFLTTLIFSIIFSLLSVIVGLYFSYYLNFPSGAAIVLTAIVFFVMSLVVKRR